MKRKLVRITTVPISLEKLLEGQLGFMADHFDVIAVSSDRKRLEDYGRAEGVRTFHLPMTRKITPFKDISCVYKLYRFLKKEKPLIVHTHTPKAGIVGMMASKFARVPIRLHTVAGLPLLETEGLKRKLLNFVEKRTYQYATKVLPNSLGLRDIIVDERLCPRTKLRVLGNGSSNGIDCDFFSRSHFSEENISATRDALGIPYSDKVFIYVGRIVKDKGINELVRAFQKIYENNSDCTLLLVGPFEDDLDPVSSETSKVITDHPKIVTTGYQEDVRIYLAISDVMVFPSYREGFPNVVMQAGAMGLPVIASDINGCNEIIVDGINGKLVSPKNFEELYTQMQEMINDDLLVKKLGENARAKIIGNYERMKMWDIILKEYRQLEANL